MSSFALRLKRIPARVRSAQTCSSAGLAPATYGIEGGGPSLLTKPSCLGVTVNPISDLGTLLKSMQPELNCGIFAFATLPSGQTISLSDVVALIQEPEGTSVVVSSADLSRLGLSADFLCAWITLTVNSDLQAVGLTAAFSTALGSAGISCNVVAGTKHDHIFVPVSQATAAIKVLHALQERAVAENAQ